MSTNEDIVNDYDKSVVKIVTADGMNVGTGFIVTDDGIICTCYHVIGDLQEQELYKDIKIYFPNTKQTVPATILLKDQKEKKEVCADPINDIAFLRISKEDQDKIKSNGQELVPLPLSKSIVFGHEFISRGFRKDDEFPDGLGSSGEIRTLTRYKVDSGIDIPIVQLHVQDIEEGMSGSPVLDMKRNKVIGMIDRTYDKEDRTDQNLVMAIPVESLIKTYEDLSDKNPGLILINQFLDHIKSAKNIKYRNFDDVYVPPKEYPKIQEALKLKKCVFITGFPEYGKTFTAIKLMWDEWKNSNKAITCHFPKTLEDKNKILQNIKAGNDNETYSNSIIYIEDPTGMTESDYKLNTVFRDSIISAIEQLPSLKSCLIVTMRENIYQRTKRDMKAGEEAGLENYIQRLEIGSPSYDYDSRKEILLRWANQMKCEWLNKKNLLKIVLEELKNQKLPTPYNIYTFTNSTGLSHENYGINDEINLKKIIHKYSQNTAQTFATNIRDINKDEDYKILFACFPFISNEYPKVYVERKFNEIMNDINPTEQDYNRRKFSAAVNYHHGTIDSSTRIQFVHPSLSEALPLILIRNDGLPDQHIQNLFSKVLVYVAYDVINLKTICSFILKNYKNLLNKEVKNLLPKVMDSKDFKYGIFNEVFANFDKI
ncbi:MAG TPA: serine protease, partial [Nitrososphaeraceae archaeon]|nr:serine protease [Nitrososphaeraceae archaeon]